MSKSGLDELWDNNWTGYGHGGSDVGAYISDGLVMLPCGRSFDERSGDEPILCKCDKCEGVREVL